MQATVWRDRVAAVKIRGSIRTVVRAEAPCTTLR